MSFLYCQCYPMLQSRETGCGCVMQMAEYTSAKSSPAKGYVVMALNQPRYQLVKVTEVWPAQLAVIKYQLAKVNSPRQLGHS